MKDLNRSDSLRCNREGVDFESAQCVKSWYECRWIIEDYHKRSTQLQVLITGARTQKRIIKYA